MFTNYQWLIIGAIIACSCLVVYGSSSTNIKEGIDGGAWNECIGNDINCHSRPTTAAMRAAGAPAKHETCDTGYKSACGPGPTHNVSRAYSAGGPGCRKYCVPGTWPPTGGGGDGKCRIFVSGHLIGSADHTMQLWDSHGNAGGTINGPMEEPHASNNPQIATAQSTTFDSILIDGNTTFTMYSGENFTGDSWTRSGPRLIWNDRYANYGNWGQMGGGTGESENNWTGVIHPWYTSTFPAGTIIESMSGWCCRSSGGSFRITCSGTAGPPPPPSTCASFISHNNCPGGSTMKPSNTPCQGTAAQGKGGTEPWNCVNSLHPVNVGTCWGDTAYSKNCGGNGQSAYEQIQRLPTAGTSHCELPNPADCGTEHGYSDGGKQAYELYLKLCGGGGSAACTSSSCCTPNPTCFSLGSCPEYSNMPTPSLVCQGPVCNRSIGGECCKPNPVCSPDVCDLNTQVFTGAGTKCVGTVCSQAECCQPRAQCNEGVQCNPDLYNQVKNYSSKYCQGVVCELSECCVADPTCHNYKCPKYYADKPHMSKIKCGEGDACDVAKCCNLNPTCSSYFGGLPGTRGNKHGGCPVHEHLNKSVAEIRCIEPQCSTGECCSFDPKCSTFKCTEDNFYHTYAHVPNAENIYCDNDLCKWKLGPYIQTIINNKKYKYTIYLCFAEIP